jgi:hypothetical protein
MGHPQQLPVIVFCDCIVSTWPQNTEAQAAALLAALFVALLAVLFVALLAALLVVLFAALLPDHTNSQTTTINIATITDVAKPSHTTGKKWQYD